CPPLGGNTGVVDSRGTTFQPESCQDSAYLAMSNDEGLNYTFLPVPTAPPNPSLTSGNIQLVMDGSDNLYVGFISADRLMLTVSRDHGQSWSAPANVTAPGVHDLVLPAIAAGPRGAVGFTYYGRPGDTTTGAEDAYVTETTDALDNQPLWFSGVINDPAHPIYYAGGLTTYPRADYVDGTYDAAGNFWAGITRQLGPPDSNNNIATTGYVGRLVTPRAPPTTANQPPVVLPNTGRPGPRVAGLLIVTLALVVGLLRVLTPHPRAD
ncbi:MAG: hypothetical protein M3010_09790, partial [Candidatus Dormibacteraeota bacterium]|nr:hypothetical protein [Candidatus Dormibacteraeota bacterium]